MIEDVDHRFIDVLRPRLKYLKPTDALDMQGELRSLGLDSLSSISLLLDLEEAFDITLPDEYMVPDTFTTAQSLWNVIQSLI